jgi:hypothetical protein
MSTVQVARREKVAVQKAEHEARVRRALERAAAPVFKKTGKPQMVRSRLVKKKAVVEEGSHDDTEAELDEWLARDLI